MHSVVLNYKSYNYETLKTFFINKVDLSEKDALIKARDVVLKDQVVFISLILIICSKRGRRNLILVINFSLKRKVLSFFSTVNVIVFYFNIYCTYIYQ